MRIVVDEQIPNTSGLNKHGSPIDLVSNEDSEYLSDTEEEEDNVRCSVCYGSQPPEVRQCQPLIISLQMGRVVTVHIGPI